MTRKRPTFPPRATLLAENDGSKLCGREGGPWHRLAVYRVGGATGPYVACLQFYAHPSKEPFRVTRAFRSPVQAAAFLISYDPLALPRQARSSFWDKQIRDAYDFQMAAVLVELDRAAPIYV